MEVDLKDKTPDIRYLYDMKDVIYDKEWLKTAPNLELYYMYRGLKEKDGLRYDITVIPARMLGKEFTKTKGHEHVGNYGEVYIVLEGEAIYLMQKRQKEKIVDVFAIKAKKGDVAVIPTGYGHVTINPSKKDLKMANWMAKGVKSDYAPILKMGGACYFAIAQKSKIKKEQVPRKREQKSKIKWIKNKNYKKVPKFRFEKPKKSLPKNLDFLKG